jgi:hypothetical protein
MNDIDYKVRCEHYEKLLGVGQYDPVKAAFIVLAKMLNQQSAFLNDFKISSHIGDNDKESPKYKRAMDMVDGLPKLITSVNDLKATLKLTKEDLAEIQIGKTLFTRITTPESIADNIGELAGNQQ